MCDEEGGAWGLGCELSYNGGRELPAGGGIMATSTSADQVLTVSVSSCTYIVCSKLPILSGLPLPVS